MANNYCLSSTMYVLTPEQHARAKEILNEVAKEAGADEEGINPGEDGYDEAEPYLGFDYKFEGEGLWMYHEESVNPDMMADVISRFQVEFKAEKPFYFEYCCECSKPRLDEFAGGCFIIMPDGSQYHSGSREDALEKAKQASQYGKVVWTANDVLTLKDDWTEEQAEEWLKANAKYIQEQMVQSGWNAIENLLP